ncbi:hypothetical protein SAMN06295955_101817 [Sphingopyxis indica]|uniref:Uncharacterized protein n=1 Tax=Sphingopyxis indica TaxID=436663 RepID=A0A239EJR6_9SPHN|nr:hypothetical protein SAMN06295955_101817 [Sphingopyxis indica]
MRALEILPARGEGDHAKHGGGGLRPAATLRKGVNPLRQPLRGCHLPIYGEDLA